ncbi:hypothetical protein FQR65_LT20243 [Abscondita terminalis]|nr:hypothetical protein FQR65_LT20243 [Abscondita terminalis]
MARNLLILLLFTHTQRASSERARRVISTITTATGIAGVTSCERIHFTGQVVIAIDGKSCSSYSKSSRTYPLWMCAPHSLSAVCRCTMSATRPHGWMPRLADMRAKTRPAHARHRGDQPEQSDGALYSDALLRGIVQVGARENLVLLVDEGSSVGLGTVGAGVFEVLRPQPGEIKRRAGLRIEVRPGVAPRHGRKPKPSGRRCRVAPMQREESSETRRDRIVVELDRWLWVWRAAGLGGHCAGKHVVTANKALLGVHGTEIFEAAQRGVCGFEGGSGWRHSINQGLGVDEG